MLRLRMIGVLACGACSGLGIATKDWVRDLVGKKEGEMDQKVDTVNTQLSGQIKTVEAVLAIDPALARAESADAAGQGQWRTRA
jgi:hypothetical protein